MVSSRREPDGGSGTVRSGTKIRNGLEIRAVTFAYGDVPVLAGASLTVRAGSRVALLGANGSGKTTVLGILSGAHEPSSGSIAVDGRPLRHNRRGLRAHRQTVQLVTQDPDDQLFSADVYRDVSFGPVNLGLTENEAAARVDEALTLLDITDLAERPTHQLSYGQRKRVAIAGAVAMQPRYLLLDEPTAGLDPVGEDELLAALERLEAAGTTVLIATHDVDLALAWAAEAAVMTGGTIDQGEPAELLGRPSLESRLRVPWTLDLTRRLGLHPDRLPRTIDEMERLLREAR